MNFRRVGVETGTTLFQGTQGLLQTFREGAPNGHHFSNTLHLGSEHTTGARQLFKCPAWNFCNDVVDGWFEARRRHLGDVVWNLIERVTHGKLCRNFRNGKTRRFRSECRGTRYTRIHFDHYLIAVHRVHCKLDV